MKKVGVLRFLGTNCDRDVFSAVEKAGLEAQWLWHQDHFDESQFSALIIPGGFSYGDYLRCGALAAKAPAMKEVIAAARKGTPILGICNGFQILCEAHLLPGVLVRNQSLRFKDEWVELNSVNSSPHFAKASAAKIKLPIAHGEGRFYVENDQVKKLFDEGQVWWTYAQNPNGSVEDIAGVFNTEKNVAGLMPHPERAIDDFMGGTDGKGFFSSLVF